MFIPYYDYLYRNEGGHSLQKMSMKQFYIKRFSYFLIISFLAACPLVFITCENPFIDEALKPKKITFESNGGSDVPNQTVYRGARISRPADPQKGEEEFLGWFTDNNYFTNEWNFSAIPENDLTLFAKWTDFYAAVIPDVNVYIEIPVKGVAPNTTAVVPEDNNYTAGSILWSPNHDPFLGGHQYSATIILTAASHHVFAKSDLNAAINDTLTASVINNTGSTLTLSYLFPATMVKDVQSVTIVSQPSKMNYIHGEHLDLSGLIVTLVYTDGTSDIEITPENFGIKGIYTSVSNEAVLNYSAAYNNHRIEISAGGVKAETNASLVIERRIISSAELTITAPVVGQIPSTMVNAGSNYTVSAVTWDPVNSQFLGSVVYTVSITLTVNTNYTFTGGLETAAINGHNAEVTNNGETATLVYTFPPTSSKSVTGISIISQPDNLIYTHGNPVNLPGLAVRLTYDDATTADVPASGFLDFDITTVPASGAQISRLSHNNNFITVIYNNSALLRANSNNLTVHPKIITITGVNAVTRPFNNSISVALDGGTLHGIEAFDEGNVGFSLGSGTLESAGVGNDKHVSTNITLTGSAASNYTLTPLTPASVLVNITPSLITMASVTVMAPAAGVTPPTTAFSTGHYSATVTWRLNGASFSGTFLNGNEYTAAITLSANENYAFAGSLMEASINGSAADTSIVSNNGTTLVLSRAFQTAAKVVTGISVTSQPSNLNYTHGETLNLTGLSVTLTYNDTTTELVPLAQFTANKITTSPAAGVHVSRLSNNNNFISVIYDNSAVIRANTNILTVNPKTITITGVTAANREYDGSTTVVLSGGTLQGVETSDTVAFMLGNGTIVNADVGNNKQVTANVSLTGISAPNYTLTQPSPAGILVNITPAQITSAAVSVTSPSANLMPSSVVFSTGHYTATVSWLRNGASFTGTFQNGNDYTATVTLTANANYAFSTSLAGANVSINGNAASTSIVSNSGSALVLSRIFQTEPKAVTSIATTSQPSNLNYTHGQALNLTGLSVTLTYNDATTLAVPLAQFAANNITTTPANNSTLSRSDHNNVPVIIIYNNSAIRATTNQLSITKAAGVAVTSQNPSFVSGNSYTAAAPATPATGQNVEYAISTNASASLSELTWQTSPAFSIMPIIAETYYWYARTAENNDYLAGTHSRSTNGITFYAVSFNSNGGSYTPSAQIVRSGQLASAPASNPTRAGFGFYGWLNGAAAWNFAANTVTANITLTADWRANQIFSITFERITDNAPNIPTGLSFSRSGASGQQTGITITATPPAGQTYTNIIWSHGGHDLSFTNTVELKSDDIRVNLIGNDKILSLTVFVNGVPYSKNVTFNVVP